ncbi:LysM peptidoglycan-binding domain-containing protein [Dyella halodurans]|uniref:LysM peptidoglycan-binding domain-containing protein n=1 Tax=Dyella halodurans TaxID=1920171 RepID=A0ABV9C8J2_9GAMM|nr:LysM domain-containing protein [Dyella halodurans]
MTLALSFDFRRRWSGRLAPAVVSLLLLGMAGCAQVSAIKSKVSDTFGGSSSTQTPAASADDGSQDTGKLLSLSAITNTYLLHGRYAEGEQHLRRYLAKYPGDRAAQSLLRQLTADPRTVLGAQSRGYVVQQGDSYSTLAARNLGDSNQFLILARYNGSTNPSALHVGDTVRLPLAGTRSPSTSGTSSTKTAVASRAATASPATDTAPAAAAEAAPLGESATARAQHLQTESTTLMKQGQQDQALARLDEALTLDPHLKPAGNQALRDQLLGSYHERAVVLYRDQKLDQAIALWDHILAIDPGYERAVIYRARAVDLQHRLQQL